MKDETRKSTKGMIYKPKKENVIKLNKWIELMKEDEEYRDKLKDL